MVQNHEPGTGRNLRLLQRSRIPKQQRLVIQLCPLYVLLVLAIAQMPQHRLDPGELRVVRLRPGPALPQLVERALEQRKYDTRTKRAHQGIRRRRPRDGGLVPHARDQRKACPRTKRRHQRVLDVFHFSVPPHKRVDTGIRTGHHRKVPRLRQRPAHLHHLRRRAPRLRLCHRTLRQRAHERPQERPLKTTKHPGKGAFHRGRLLRNPLLIRLLNLLRFLLERVAPIEEGGDHRICHDDAPFQDSSPRASCNLRRLYGSRRMACNV
mmetsp:Transcript_11580/g.32500  ORF Transcript_11580/g.32500 Transcript_11580/m.32500 type:complete len:266 (+) Transcript_11580:6932-7729(+)